MIKNTKENLDKFNSYIKHKNYNDLDIIDLIKYLSSLYGVSYKKDDVLKEKFKKLDKIISPSNEICLILVDGLGYYKVKSLGEDSVLKRGLKTSLQTVNPTSTACVLTSICSTSYPTEHGIYGWTSYKKDDDINFYPLLTENREGEKLKKREISNIYDFKSVFDKLNVSANIYMNRNIINSEYTNVFAGKKANKYGTYSVRDAFNRISRRLGYNDNNSFTYLYISEIDTLSHRYGVDSQEVNNMLQEIEQGIISIKEKDENVTVIVIADHGQLDMQVAMNLNQFNDYNKYFYTLPTIDTRTISFFVKEEFKEEFENTFSYEFSNDILLLTKEQVQKYNLFGNNSFSKKANNSIGEYVGIVMSDKFLIHSERDLEDLIYIVGNHSGITKKETTIPLIVI